MNKTRYVDGVLQIWESRPVDLDWMPIADVIEELAQVSSLLIDPILNLEMENDYGRWRINQTMEGWRIATDQQIIDHERDKAEERGRIKARQDRDIEALRAARPELFK